MHRWWTALLGSALSLGLGACGDSEQALPPRPDFHRAPPTAPPEAAHHTKEVFHRPAPDLRERPSGRDNPGPLRVTETRELPSMNEQPRRDLSAELRTALGDPSSCIPAGAANLPQHATLSVTAYVSITGMVTRATASAPGFPAQTATCMARRAESVHLRGPVPDAPRAVSASLELRALPPPPGDAGTPAAARP